MVTGMGATGHSSSRNPAWTLLLVAVLGWKCRGACRTFPLETEGKVSQNGTAQQVAARAPWFNEALAVLPGLTAVINPARRRSVPDQSLALVPALTLASGAGASGWGCRVPIIIPLGFTR